MRCVSRCADCIILADADVQISDPVGGSRMKRRKRIGILGGTFNPIHLGHLLIAEDAMEQLGLDRVKFIPSATPPHKTVDKLASERDRLRMIALAIGGNARFEADDTEIRRGGKSYSVDTLRELRWLEPRASF